jgi:diguanylate cyclase (GGDEF)-like protein
LTGVYNRRYFEDAKKRLDNTKNYPLSIIVGDINGLKLINESFGHKEGDKILVSIADVLKSCCRPRDVLARTGGDEFSILMPNTPYEEANQILTRISDLCNEFSNLNTEYYLSFSAGLATKADDIMSMNRLIKMAEDSMYRNKLLQNKSLHSSMINSMKTSLYEKSQETEEHAMRLIEISRAFGRKLNLVEEQLIELELLSTLHDIGKISITDNILNKPGKLTVDEWVKMKQHPEAGYRIAMATPELKQIADYILNHHERWDGSGYPYGKKGDEIPLLSRIISIADAYDAMTTDRPYRKAMSKSEALDEIKRNAGSQFDPRLAELFINEIAIYL